MHIDPQDCQNKINEFQSALLQVQALENLAQKVTDAENFAIITKNGMTHFVIMSEDQARVVNGDSIALTTLATLPKSFKDLTAQAIKAALNEYQNKLAPLTKATPSVTGLPVTIGINATTGGSGPLPPKV